MGKFFSLILYRLHNLWVRVPNVHYRDSAAEVDIVLAFNIGNDCPMSVGDIPVCATYITFGDELVAKFVQSFVCM
jgi:hypothetical protein